jgi:hypothetical protein
MKASLERVWFPLLVAALAISGLLVLATALPAMYDFDPSSPWTRLFSIPWFYFGALSAGLFAGSAYAWKYSPHRQVESQAEQAKIQMWNRWYSAFLKGSSSEYPQVNASSFGYLLRPGEVCYIASAQAVLGRGSAHQLEITESADAGVDLKGVKFGKAAGTKDTYSTVRYDENHLGSLIVSNQRVSFISPPSIFIELLPEHILSIGWLDQYVIMRTNVSTDDTKNLVAIRITDLPAWIFASSIFRLKADNLSPVPPTSPPAANHN